MRRLAQPDVLKAAAIGALLTTLLSYPRLSAWTTRPFPIWYLEAVLFFTSIVLWAFVFAWHTQYTQRPVITFNLSLSLFALATAAGVLAAVGQYFLLDPTLRIKAPEDYPKSFDEWLAMTLFILAFTQLFLLFAPFAWLVRLFKNPRVAVVLTLFFGVLIFFIRMRSFSPSLSPTLFLTIITVRIVAGLMLIWLYLRGGLILVWWVGLLVEARHLLSLNSQN